MKKRLLILLFVLMLCAACTVSAAEEIGGNVTAPPTTVTTQPTTVPTTEPTTVPTTVPTTIPTTVPTTVPTMVPTTVATTSPTITIWTTAIGGDQGWFDIYVNVNGATVMVNGKTVGATPPNPVITEVYSTGAPATVRVTAPGYVDWSDVPGNPPAGQHVRVNADLIPIVTTPPTKQPTTAPTTIPPVQNGAIYAQSSPAGAAIYMNGVLYGYSPVTLPNLQPGPYSMKAVLNGYTTDVTTVNVNAGQTSPYYPVLQPSPPPPRSTGTVSATSNPNYALVYVDGTYQGKTPVVVTLYTGSHQFVLKLSGYNDYSQTVWVNAGTTQNLNAVMTPSTIGWVALTSMPGASVSMDNVAQGKVPSSGTLMINNVASGNHLFSVSAPGYNDWINTVYVQPNVQTTISVTLTPKGPNPTPVPAAGSLNIVSTPSGAEVLIDNLFRGYTPATLDGIAPGQHTVLLKYTGYVDYSATATVNPGQTTPLAIAMNPAPTPTPPESAPSPVLMAGGLLAILGIGIALRRRN